MTTRISVAQSLRVYSASSTIHHPDGPSEDERRSSGDHVVVEREKIRFSSCGWRASEFPERRLRADDVVYTTGKRTHTHTNVIARASRLFPVSASPPAFPPFFTAGALIPHRRPGISVRILELNQTTGRNQDEGRGLVAFLDFYILARHLLTAQSLQQQQQQQQEENNAE